MPAMRPSAQLLAKPILIKSNPANKPPTNRETKEMKEYFTFDNLPMTIIVALIVMSWLSALSVIFFG